MDLLDQSVLPQSPQHLQLIRYLLSLSFTIFIPYVSVLVGTLSFSLYFRRKGQKTGSGIYTIFSKDLIDLATINKSISFGFALIPILSSIFGYSQLLHSSNSGVPGFLLISFVILAGALLFIYTYKYTFHLKDIFKYADAKKDGNESDNEIKHEISTYSQKTALLNNKTGFYGLLLLLFSIYIVIGSVEFASDSTRWEDGNNLLGIIFSSSTLIGFIQFIIGSAVITSAFIIFRLLRQDEESANRDEDYISFVKTFSLRLGLVSIILFSILIILSVFTQPVNSLSFSFFGSILLILIVLFLTSFLFYFMIKESNIKYSQPVIYLVIAAFALIVIKDQFAFETSAKMHSEILAGQYDEYIKKFEEATGTTAPINGADIYNGRCIACHSFDHKVVGPPYKQTLPKYEGKINDLVAFIMNPVKKNPDYPSMPSQGLKQNEAQVVAEYLLKTYKTK